MPLVAVAVCRKHYVNLGAVLQIFFNDAAREVDFVVLVRNKHHNLFS